MTADVREFDVVLFGAGGFVGAQTAGYFARHAPSDLRWAIAGASPAKLAATQARAVGREVDAVVVDGRDPAAVDALAARARIVVSAAGPFALYSDALVSACVRRQTHYVDITGETPWVRSLIDRHHETAARQGTRIVPCCGFDSVPSDLGVFLAVRQLQREGADCRSARAYFRMVGGLNGGTAATVALLYDAGQTSLARDPFLLGGAPPPATTAAEQRDPTSVRFDAEAGAWVGPFLMGAVNTRVVRRSAALFDEWGEPYGADFAYQEYAKYEGRFAFAKAVGVSGALATFDAGMRWAGARYVLRGLLPKPGAGPSEKSMDHGWFRCDVVASDGQERTARVRMSHQGDPSNRATVRFVCESALCLALDAGSLPGGRQRGGVLTPATAFGDALAGRLRRSGMTIESLDAE